MELPKTKSLDSILSLDCEEDIELDHSSLDTDILNNNEKSKPKKHHRHYKSKSEHRSRRNDQKGIKYCDSGRAFVTQEIHVERQHFQCIINLNTTVCDHGSSLRRSCDGKSSKDSKYKRIVPHCLRQLCRQPRQEQRFNKKIKEHCTADLHYQARHANRVHECQRESKQDIHRNRYPRHEKKPSKEKFVLKVNGTQKKSPPKKKLEQEYEDVSTTSFHSDLDVPTSYKYVVNDPAEYHESKLDTLIKRTKERERRLVEESRTLSWYSSTPAYTEASSEFPATCSEIDISLHSRSTLILEPRDDHSYSHPIEGLCQAPTIEKYLQSTPSSLIQNLFPSDLEFNIKSEPTMDIEVYSPSQNYDLPELIEKQWIKNEVKIEPSNS